MLKCVFFDRDGVLIKDYGYVHNPLKTKWLKGSIEAIKFLNKKKILIIIITNQSGIARGIFGIKELNNFHNHLKKDLIDQKKNELFNLYSRSHLSKLKNTSLIEYK